MSEEINIEARDSYFTLGGFADQALPDFQEFSLNVGHKVIYMCSPGGTCAIAIGMLEIINEHPEEYTIKVSELCGSSAFNLIHLAKCKVIDVSNAYYMPTTYIQHYTIVKGMLTKKEVKDTIYQDDRYWDSLSHVLTKKQLTKVKRKSKLLKVCYTLFKHLPCDIEFSVEQMQELLGDRFSVK